MGGVQTKRREKCEQKSMNAKSVTRPCQPKYTGQATALIAWLHPKPITARLQELITHIQIAARKMINIIIRTSAC